MSNVKGHALKSENTKVPAPSAITARMYNFIQYSLFDPSLPIEQTRILA